MGRGLFGGIVWGIVLSGLVLVVLALVGPPPTRPGEAPVPPMAGRPEAPPSQTRPPEAAPETAPPAAAERPGALARPEPARAPATDIELPPGSEFNRRPPDREASLPSADEGRRGAPPVRGPDAGGAAIESPRLDTAPGAAPAPVTSGPDGLAPPLSAEAPPDFAADEPVQTAPGATAPLAVPPERDDMAVTAPDVLAEVTAGAGDGEPAAQDAVPAPGDGDAQAATDAGGGMRDPVEPAQPRIRPLPVLPERAEGGDVGMTGMQAEAPPDSPPGGALRVPAPSGGIEAPDIRTGRLPMVGTAPPETAADAAQPPEAAQEPAEDGAEAAEASPGAMPREGLGALARNAVPFQPAADRPLFSVILIDAGEEGLDRAALMTFSFPVTFAVDPNRPDADEAMAAYRAAGYEVVALATGLPQGATPGDLEVALAAQQGLLDRAVAVMDVAGAGFQDDRALTAQMVAFAGETGHGLVTYDRGLNSAARLAGQAGVPQATVFRMLDEDRPNAPTIRRIMDRAVFKARQDGHVVMVGHSYSDTVTALYSWALEAEAEAVTLAPISAVLRRR
ncbi:divergent polysaccharide deacetylase family protein [Rhodovulum tesquicola]|uniref:divergent polysaccharide deacetylase family protein n=1 Tax=Rhodovulum tesquicola TaxID=540254 RepID=UPI002097D58E|nr:divergent polysaccharide deacetylase family protein [Rhodovulum tesquicola]MCO8144343.1 divergent polysaccharide deacetylase family protein [Rhodovulum tesquicola]